VFLNKGTKTLIDYQTYGLRVILVSASSRLLSPFEQEAAGQHSHFDLRLCTRDKRLDFRNKEFAIAFLASCINFFDGH
jgi:hypothetical protein